MRIEQCRAEVDAELARLQQAINAEKWTEEKAPTIGAVEMRRTAMLRKAA